MLTALPSPFSSADRQDFETEHSVAVWRGKLAPPQLAFEAVLSRSAQVLLRSAVLARLVTVCAPPGYGKTVLLQHLHQSLAKRGQQCLWVALDDRDVSVNSLLFLIQSSMTAEGIAGEAAVSQPPMDDSRHMVERVLHLLEHLSKPTTLLIDNLSYCTDPLLVPLLERLVFSAPPQLRLIFSGVDRLPFDVTRARLELGAVELRAAHLAFDRESTALFLKRTHVPHDASTVARVQELTEGWPAAVRLVQILMTETDDPGSVLEHFNGSDHDVADMLTRRVLAGLDTDRAAFLLEIAPLREFSADLAEHVTGRPGAAAWINDLLDRNLFVFPLDRSRQWVRMHSLLRQHLLAEGYRSLPRERRREILERAAHWHADRGDNEAALEAALEAPAPVLAARMLDRLARTVVGGQGRLALYIRWVTQLLACGVELSLEAHTWYVWSLCFTLQYERAYRTMDTLDHRLAELDPQEQLRGLHARLGLLRVVVAINLDLMTTAREEARRWLHDGMRRDPVGIVTVAGAAATAELALGNIAAARQYTLQALSAVTRSASHYANAWTWTMSACVELAHGDPLAADRMLTQARAVAVEKLGEDAGVVATLDFVHARALLDLGRTESARAKAASGLARASVHGLIETTIQGFAACVALWDGSEQHPFGPEALDAIARSYPPRALRALALLQVQRLLSLGRARDAQELARRQLLDLKAILNSESSLHERLIALRLQGATGNSRQVLDEVDRLLRVSIASPRETVELHLLAAQLHLQADQKDLARRSLSLAVAAAAARRLLHPFIDRLAIVGQILCASRNKDLGLTLPDEVALLGQLHERVKKESADSPNDPESPSSSTLPEALTNRELQLLDLVAHGLSNQQVADRLALSVPTVKWHLSNIYGKLGVKSRAAALARARVLQLLRG